MIKARRIAGALLVAGGLGALADAALTVVWQDPVGAVEAPRAQRELRREYAAMAGSYANGPIRSGHQATMRRAHLAARLDSSTRGGRPLGRLRIPRIDLTTVWVQGTDPAALIKGPGHYPGTVLPGRHGTFGLAGHRTTHGAPFRRLDRLRRGDRIDVSMPYGAYSYAVTGTQIISPEQTSVLQAGRTDRIVLTACHPLWSAAQRIVVTARLVSGPGRRS